ncbi:Protoporphyrinogen oxidase [Fusarium austroafricanum]|uniref:Protoporphyrinogen oxidase n=1 Tax=Fusarium austroafricanum TaxID=2364996 RepID=A0A8H4NXT1_9HYPO|nr:Protoporphyrinogen oxidase [Fusarium austroafricanum]
MSRRRAETMAVALSSSAAPFHLQLPLRHLNGIRSLSTCSALTRRRPIVACKHTQTFNDGRRYISQAKDAKIAVLGGGLTGLTAAYYLAKKLPSTARITLYESSNRLGGWIKTDRVPVDIEGKNGIVTFERGARSLSSLAGNTFRFDDLVLYDLALDLGLTINSPTPMPRYIYYPDHLVATPPNINIFDIFREPLYLESIGASLGLGINSLRKRHLPTEDQSVSDWLYAVSNSRKGAGTLASAMMHGIYGGDINKLSARCVLDRVYWGWYLPNPGMTARPMPLSEQTLLETLGQDKQIQKMALEPRSALVDFGDKGMESLPKALAAALREQPNVTIQTGEAVKEVLYHKTDQQVHIISSSAKDKTKHNSTVYDKVISTLSAQDIARLSGDKLPSLSTAHSASVMTVNIWFPQENLKPPGFGYLIPNSVSPELNPEHALGVFFDSDVQTRSKDEPTGTKLFVLMGGHYYDRPDVTPPTEEEAIIQARSLLERHLGISRDAPAYATANFAKECIPQHYVGHQDRLRNAHAELTQKFGGRLAVAGGSFTRIGAVASLRAGYDVAVATKESLEATGLEYLNNLEQFAVVATSEIPVRHFK